MTTALFTTRIQTASYNTIAQNSSAQNSFANSSLVVIDANVEDYQLLASHAVDGAIVLVLDPDRDGIEQITEAIQTCSQLGSLHIVSHGSPGCLYLGNAQLNLETIDHYAEQIKTWLLSSPHLSLSPSLILYGCNVAAGDSGEEFVEKLQSITGASIAASSSLTGNAAKGGNWELDFQTDPFRVDLAFTRQALDTYCGILTIDFDPASLLWTNLKRTNDPNKGATDASWTANASDLVGDSNTPYIQIQTDGTNIAFKVLAEPQSGDFKALMGIFIDVDQDGSPDLTVQLNVGNVTNNYQVAEYTFIPIETGIAADANTRPNNTVIPATNSGTYFNLKSGGTANNPANVQIYGPAARTGVNGIVDRDVDADNSQENYYVFSFTLAQLDTFRTAVTNTHNGGTPGSVYKEIPQWPATQTNVYAVGLTASNSLNAVNGDIGGGAYALTDTWKDIFGFEPPDTTAPTIAITSDKTTLNAGETATLTFTLSEASTDFVEADITVSGGTLSNFTGSGTTYTATFTPTPNSPANGLISVASAKFSDAAGNQNTDGADADNSLSLIVNIAPVAVDDPFSVATNSTTTLDLITNDTDSDNDPLSVKSINGTALTPGTAQTIAVTNGTVNVDAAGVITFTPDANYTGAIVFDYIVQDGNGGEDTGTANGTVTAGNAPPVAVDDPFSVAANGTATLDLITNDTDSDNDPLSVKSINGTALTPGTAQTIAVTNGTVNVSDTGAITFTPDANYTGAIGFDYIVQDGNGGEDTGTANGTVTAGNTPPVAVDDPFSVAANGTATLDLITNDTDSDNDPLSVKSINGTALTPGTAQTIAVTNGTVNVDAAGAITFTPDANYTGAIVFDYIVQDGNGGEDTGTANGTVTAGNAAPVAVDDPFSVAANGTATLDLITNDTDSDNDPLSVKSINGTALTPGTAQTIAVTNGTVNVSDTGVITFTPDANYTGAIVFDYIVQDGNGGEDTGTANGTVTAGNAAPVAVDDPFSVAANGTTTLDLIGNDTDADGDPLSVKSINGTDLTPGTAQTIAVTNGTVNVSAAGAITFTPDANYTGAIVFDYIVQDGNGGEDTGTVSGTVQQNIDTDNDGVQDGNDLDDDNDGILDSIEQNGNPARDTDGDSIIDALDVDADNDGITDLKESGLTPVEIASLDANGDGVIDASNVFGANGLADAVETTPESGTPDYNNDGTADVPVDTDGDGVKDFQDLDVDNDGINDVVEAGGIDANGDGVIDGAGTDTDGDGLADVVDPGNSGTPLPVPDTDSDGAADFRDLDSDNDGLSDITEAGFNPDTVDRNRDGVIDGTDGDGDGIRDLTDGVPAAFGDQNGPASNSLPDADQDNTPDYQELDRNNNGTPDRIEAGLPTGSGTPDTNSDGKVDVSTDTDHDGIADSIDSAPGIFGGFSTLQPGDHDGDGIADANDLDDDNDGIPDQQEGSGDTDQDGLADAIDLDADNDGMTDTIEAGGTDKNGDGLIDGFTDTNLDGLADSVDPAQGGSPLPVFDTDGDGIKDFRDRDSDNDGVMDILEAGGSDANGDGFIDGFTDTDGNGLADGVDGSKGGQPLPVFNTDGDNVADYRDLDSDNDGIGDVLEAGGSDPDRDGLIGSGTPLDPDRDGVASSVDPDQGGIPLSVPDQDGDLQPNYRDLDSDNDGIKDLTELGGNLPDANSDGKVDGADSDGDGLIDVIDGNNGGFGSGLNGMPQPQDLNNNGIADFLESPRQGGGSQGADDVTGTSGNDILNGFSDLDILRGGEGNDTINGGSDQDILRGDVGDDILNGGSNNDDMDGGVGNDILNGGTGDDTMLGNDGDDILNGGPGKDLLQGGLGNDLITGNEDKDRLFGDEGNDKIRGDRGNDIIVGGFGKDTLTGGQGRDRFAYHSVEDFGDIITDFEIVKDRFDFKDFFKDSGSMTDVQLKQRGDDVLLKVNVGNSFKTLGIIQDVETETLKARHFIF